MNFTELNSITLNQYITNQLNLIIKEDSLLIQAKKTKFKLDLSSLNYFRADIHFKKVSGNGRLLINKKEIRINSNKNFIYTIFDKIIEIESFNLAVGNIKLEKFNLFLEEIKESEAVDNWKSIINKCGAYKGLILSENTLKAVQGAYIERGYAISNLETIPPGAFYRDGDNIKFNIDCEISKLEINHSFYESKKNLNFNFMARKDYLPVIKESNKEIIKNNENNIPTISEKNKPNNLTTLDFVIHDTNINGKFPENIKNKVVRYLNSGGKDYLNIKKDGKYYLNIGTLDRNFKYILVITGKKLSGNGKISVGFSKNIDNNPSKWFTGYLDNNMTEKNINLISDDIDYYTDGAKLHLALLEDSVGEVLINRILLVKDLNINTARVAGENFYPTEEPLILNNKNYANFSVKNSTREAALSKIFEYDFNYKINSPVTIEPINYSARNWVSKIYKTFNLLNIKDKKNLIENSVYDIEPNLVMTRLGSLKESKRIYIEEFNVKNNPSINDINILKNCDSILTPSLPNKIILSQFLAEKQLLLVKRPWNIINEYNFSNNKFYLYFEKYESFTQELIKNWLPQYPTLYIVGSTCGSPSYIKHISSYEDYDKIQNYLINCEALLDFNINNNYNSGILDICKLFNINVITNNTNYTEDNFNILSNINQEKLNDYINIINSKGKTTIINTDKFINYYKQSMTDLFGVAC